MGVFAGIEKNWASQLNDGRTHVATKGIVQSGLVLNLDAGVSSSYSGSGITWTDLSGNGNNGTLTNGPTYSSANGGSLAFDGINEYVNFGNIFNNVFAGVDKKFSISSWVKCNNLTTSADTTILSKLGDSSFSENQRQIFFTVRNPSNAYGSFELEFFAFFALNASSFAGYRTVNANIQANQFYNFAISYDGSIDASGRYGLFVNGIQYSVTSTFTSGAWGNIQSGNARLAVGAAIGENISNSPSSLINGNIAQVSIYNRALTAAEIQRNFLATRYRFGI